MNSADLIQELRLSSPDLRALYAEHLQDNDDLLPHVLMADIARYAEEQDAKAAQGSRQAADVIERLLATLERGMCEGDGRCRDLIAASFVEILDRDSPRFAALALRFGEGLSAVLERQRGLYGDDAPNEAVGKPTHRSSTAGTLQGWWA
jgi:hypothetical protein